MIGNDQAVILSDPSLYRFILLQVLFPEWLVGRSSAAFDPAHHSSTGSFLHEVPKMVIQMARALEDLFPFA